jgi:hypothetical protein
MGWQAGPFTLAARYPPSPAVQSYLTNQTAGDFCFVYQSTVFQRLPLHAFSLPKLAPHFPYGYGADVEPDTPV